MLTNGIRQVLRVRQAPVGMPKWYVAAAALTLTLVLTVGGLFLFHQSARAQEETPDPNRGVLVASVQPDSPAAEAGIVRGDIIQSVNDEPVDLVSELTLMLDEMAPGDEVTLSVLHGDDVRSLTATLGERGPRAFLGIVPCGTGPVDMEGFGGRPFQMPERPFQIPGMPQMPESFDLEIAPGARIVEVVPDSPAATAGLQPGDVIVRVDDTELGVDANLADIIASYEPGDEITLEIVPADAPGDEEADEDAESDTDEEVTETFEVVIALDENEEGNTFLGVSYAPALDPRFFMPESGVPQFEAPEPPEPEEEIPFEMPEGDVAQEVVVMQVAPDSPAAEAGLQEGDVIVAVDDEPIAAPDELVDAIAQYAPGDTVMLTVRSADGEEITIEVTLDENEAGNAFLGVSISSMIRSERPGDDEGFAPSPHFRNLPDGASDGGKNHYLFRLPQSEDWTWHGTPDVAPDADVVGAGDVYFFRAQPDIRSWHFVRPQTDATRYFFRAAPKGTVPGLRLEIVPDAPSQAEPHHFQFHVEPRDPV